MGDSGLTTLVTGVVALSLAVPKETRGLAWRWAMAFVLVTSLVFATKLGVLGWGAGIKALDFRGPSGHATLSAFVWPMLAWRLTVHARHSVRAVALVLGAGFAMAIAWILVAYNFHSMPEVLAGLLLGGWAAGACIRAARLAPPPPRHITVLVGLVVAALFGMQHGEAFAPLTQFKLKAHRIVALADPSVVEGRSSRLIASG